MTRDEIGEALANGERVRHKFFTDSEWMEQVQSGRKKGMYKFEDGVTVKPRDFWRWRRGGVWEYDWEIV